MSSTPSAKPATSVLLTVLAVLTAIAGQFAFYLSLESFWPGTVLTGLALLMFWASGNLRWPAAWEAWAGRFQRSSSRGLIALAISLSVMATALAIAFYQTERVNYMPVVVLNLFGGLCYLAGFVTEWRIAVMARNWLTAHWREGVIVAAITLVAAGLRFYELGELPGIIDGDEGYIGNIAIRLAEPGRATPYMWPAEFGGYYMQALRFVIEIFDRTPWALRLLPALAGSLAVPSLYLFTRHLFGPRAAILAAILLATSHSHIHFSRIVSVAYVVGTCVAPLVLYLFISGLEKNGRARLAASGLLLAVYLGIYFDAYIIAAALYLFPVAAYVLNRNATVNFRGQVMVFWGAVLVGALPLITHTLLYPASFAARFAYDGTFTSGWLANEVVVTGQSAAAILLGRVVHALLALNSIPAYDFYGSHFPLLSIFTSAFYVLGLMFGLWHTRELRWLMVNAYFWSITVAVGVFSLPPSADSYRMLAAVPAAMIFAAIGIEQTVLYVLRQQPIPTYVRRIALALMLLAMGTFNVSAYFQDFAGRCRFSADHQTRFSSRLGSYLQTVEREAPVLLLSTPNVRQGINQSVDFLSRNRSVTNVDAPVQSVTIPPRSIVIASPDRIGELQNWVSARQLPGELQGVYDCGQLLLLAYHAP